MPSLRSLPTSSELDSLLRESTARFIADHRNGVTTNFSSFTSIFSRLIFSPDLPLEVVWFHSAVTFHITKPEEARRGRVEPIREMFTFIVNCSASFGQVKRIAMLAPAVHQLFHLVASEKERRMEIRNLLEALVWYISISCAEIRDEEGEDRRLGSCFVDVVRLWLVDRFGIGDELGAFFPIVGSGVVTEMKNDEPFRLCRLAGIVMCEAFLLRLCLRLGLGSSRDEAEKDVRTCAAQMISHGFQCFSFFETLMKTMLEPVLPVLNLLICKDECFLREVLYDSLIMANLSCFKSQQETLLPSDRLKNIAAMWLLIVEDAICFARKYGIPSRAVMYTRFFSESRLTSHLIQWITSQNGMQGKIAPNVSTPTALIQWILVVEDQGVKVFDSDISKFRAMGVTCSSRSANALPDSGPVNGNLDMMDLNEDTPIIEGQRKRKGTMFGGEPQVKSVKFQASSAGLICESQMENPASDTEMDDNMQQ